MIPKAAGSTSHDGFQSHSPHSHSWRQGSVLGILLALPSTAFVQKYAGMIGVVLYVPLMCAACRLLFLWFPRFGPWIRKHLAVLTTTFCIGLVGIHLGLHPVEDGKGPGKSSDRDEGLEMAVSRLLEGRNPYYPSNHVAGPLSVLPGAIVLASPFVLLGAVGLQNTFWLIAFLAVAASTFRNGAFALALLAMSLALSPALQYEYVSGGDLIANGIYVAVFLWFAIRTWSADTLRPAWALTAALLLGVGFASRANFILLLPLFSAWIWKHGGYQRSLVASAFVVFAFAAITLPFYLFDPPAFTPLMSRNKLDLPLLPSWTGAAIIGATALCSVGLALKFLRGPSLPLQRFFQASAVVTLVPMVLPVLALSFAKGRPDFSFLHDRFGLLYVFFALLGFVVFAEVGSDSRRGCEVSLKPQR